MLSSKECFQKGRVTNALQGNSYKPQKILEVPLPPFILFPELLIALQWTSALHRAMCLSQYVNKELAIPVAKRSPSCGMCCKGKFPKSHENKIFPSSSNFKNSDRWLNFYIFLHSHIQFSKALPTWIKSTLWNVLWLAIYVAARRKPKTAYTEC